MLKKTNFWWYSMILIFKNEAVEHATTFNNVNVCVGVRCAQHEIVWHVRAYSTSSLPHSLKIIIQRKAHLSASSSSWNSILQRSLPTLGPALSPALYTYYIYYYVVSDRTTSPTKKRIKNRIEKRIKNRIKINNNIKHPYVILVWHWIKNIQSSLLPH